LEDELDVLNSKSEFFAMLVRGSSPATHREIAVDEDMTLIGA